MLPCESSHAYKSMHWGYKASPVKLFRERELRTSKEELVIGNMTTHGASALTFTTGLNSSDLSNPDNNPFRLSGSSHPYKPHLRMDHPEVGLGILNTLTDHHTTKPLSGVLFEPSKSKNIVFGPQVKNMNMNMSFKSSPGTPPVPRSNMVPPPLIVGSSGAYEVGEPSGSVPIRVRVFKDYNSTLVISHPPFPKMTHDFDDCVLGCNPCKFLDFLGGERPVRQRNHQVDNFYNSSTSSYPLSQYFLRMCFTCKRQLKPGKDIYIYRGEQSFCSEECRFEEMLAERMAKAANKNSNPKSYPALNQNGSIFFLDNTTPS
ncbi:Protein MARD1 [Camellia lanceoleosa]|uniref:Protein MARD1 n=1 Tax=Camellia lanceoleosa TaxID=1840588 RepID=A0ACC0FCE9_9ERIC|nr:Protein MARD1 [Camellia lanceoleosa]